MRFGYSLQQRLEHGVVTLFASVAALSKIGNRLKVRFQWLVLSSLVALPIIEAAQRHAVMLHCAVCGVGTQRRVPLDGIPLREKWITYLNLFFNRQSVLHIFRIQNGNTRTQGARYNDAILER
ncbi:MAG: hypothetical protein KatS3mg058_3032 [Roseiflexus sp.]|nr:MAG: hypothetical protein KatS3mg058_3032 [Roseiflexus sp.]